MYKKRLVLITDVSLIIVIVLIIFNSIAAIYLKNVFINEVHENTKGSYSLSIKSLRLNLLTGSIYTNELHFLPINSNFSSFSSSISIVNADLYGLIFKKRIDIGIIKLSESSIIFKSKIPVTEDKDKTDSTDFALYDLFRDKYKSVSVNEIIIENPSVKYYQNNNDTSFLFSTDQGKIHIKGLWIDSITTYVGKKPFNAKSLDINLKNITNNVGDSLYTLLIPNLNLSYTDNKITIDSFSMTPNFSKKEFAEKVKFQTDRFIIKSAKIECSNIDVKSLLEKFEWKSETLTLYGLNISGYRNKYKPFKKKYKKLLQELIEDFGIPIQIKKIEIPDAYVEYEELLPPASEPGKIYFTNLNATFENVTNNNSDDNNPLKLIATARIFDKSLIALDLSFPYKKFRFSGTGKIVNLEMSKLNSMLESASGATITDGFIDSINFILSADSKKSIGEMTMVYKDLRIAAKNIKTKDTTSVMLRAKSFLVNKILIKDSNPNKSDSIRKVDMERDYTTYKFMIFNMWKTIMVGIQKTIGVPVREKEEE
jgi:hypothetical protein